MLVWFEGDLLLLLRDDALLDILAFLLVAVSVFLRHLLERPSLLPGQVLPPESEGARDLLVCEICEAMANHVEEVLAEVDESTIWLPNLVLLLLL